MIEVGNYCHIWDIDTRLIDFDNVLNAGAGKQSSERTPGDKPWQSFVGSVIFREILL